MENASILISRGGLSGKKQEIFEHSWYLPSSKKLTREETNFVSI
jgi:hypothetical protein